MRASALNRQYLGQNTLQDLDAEYAAGGAANQSHAPRAAMVGGAVEADLAECVDVDAVLAVRK
jgi:hypothetical protein